MMAPKVSGDAELGRHYPPVAALSGTGIFRTTLRYTIRTVLILREKPIVYDGEAKHKSWPSN